MEKTTETMNKQENLDDVQEVKEQHTVEGQHEGGPDDAPVDGSHESAKLGQEEGKDPAPQNVGEEEAQDPRGRSLSQELREKYEKNPYILHINNVGDITYTHSFYVDMYGYIRYAGKTYEEAYEALGFKVEELGKNRAWSAGKRAVRMAEDGTLYRMSPGKFNGTISYESMKLDEMDTAEQIGQLTARVIYLETLTKTQKKTFFTQGIKR